MRRVAASPVFYYQVGDSRPLGTIMIIMAAAKSFNRPARPPRLLRVASTSLDMSESEPADTKKATYGLRNRNALSALRRRIHHRDSHSPVARSAVSRVPAGCHSRTESENSRSLTPRAHPEHHNSTTSVSSSGRPRSERLSISPGPHILQALFYPMYLDRSGVFLQFPHDGRTTVVCVDSASTRRRRAQSRAP